MSLDTFCLIETTVNNTEIAQKIAHQLVEKKLAACVNLSSPTLSIYSWQGKTETETEIVLHIKTRESLIDACYQTVLTQHPYDVPQWLVYPVLDGSNDYLAWMKASTLSNTHE
ncbi:MAG: divalent-cation tolerance protein CutA [Alcaligenaceae bacterium]|nr:divalent-cation tolerance protein CutA [Alcaligenaceae bacterium]